jgi:hypothetical protein
MSQQGPLLGNSEKSQRNVLNHQSQAAMTPQRQQNMPNMGGQVMASPQGGQFFIQQQGGTPQRLIFPNNQNFPNMNPQNMFPIQNQNQNQIQNQNQNQNQNQIQIQQQQQQQQQQHQQQQQMGQNLPMDPQAQQFLMNQQSLNMMNPQVPPPSNPLKNQ